MVAKRIGFACKWIDTPEQVNGIKPKDNARIYSTQTTTLAWLNRQHKDVAYERMWQIMQHNIRSVQLLIERVASLQETLRMVRLSSEILPMYSEPTWSTFYKQRDVEQYMVHEFALAGEIARARGVRLSFHPGQFTVLASENPETVANSVREFEYHVDMARMMGYARKFQDFKINVHIAGRLGPAGIRSVYPRLSKEAQRTITIENEELTHGLDACLELADIVPIVFDLHHHWVKTGEYMPVDDPRVAHIVASWQGVRPVMHYSQSRESVLPEHDCTVKPDHRVLVERHISKTKLRAHSDFFWNQSVNEHAATFLDTFDIMCESKAKNLASMDFLAKITK
jgi:UV DNA damage endonuclease